MSSKVIFTLLLCLFVITVYASAAEQRRCIPGKSYFDGCNRCMCVGHKNKKTGIACTKMYCHNSVKIPPPNDFWE